MKSRVAAAFVSAIVVAGCARGGFVEDTSGAGGGATMASTSGSGMTTTSSASTSGASTSGATTSGSTSASSTTSVASSSSSGLMCDADEHICNAMCAGNTVETGCFLSPSCNPCPAPPALGTEICNANGQCDFTCPMGYNKVGSACACATQCCTQADCSGNQTCTGGMCVGTCDEDQCDQSCAFTCVQMGKFPVSQCMGNTCNCVCI